MEYGFDSKKYLKLQSEKIKERIKNSSNKLYLEFGGKLIDDYHAMRVLPGFEPDIKIKLLEEFKDMAEILFCINANDIEKNRIRADYGINYASEIIRLIVFLRKRNIVVNNVVITLFNNQPGVSEFIKKLKTYKIKTYIHTYTKGYPTDINTIVSDEGYGANPYIETTKPLVVVSAPGPNSGKLATCLSQLYHEYKRGIKAGYSKFETFPVWDLPLKHPVNMAYEAATADIKDKNIIDYFHLEKYGITAVSYNRDIEVFPVLKDILYKITGKIIYNSPTDMGVNVIGKCIISDKKICEASKAEIIRRYYKYLSDYKMGISDIATSQSVKVLMNELNISENDRLVVNKALEKKKKEKVHVVALSLPNKKIITGKQKDILSPTGSLILNAIKELSKISDDIDLLAPNIINPVIELKREILKNEDYSLSLEEVLFALSICSVTNPIIKSAISKMSMLKFCEAHSTYILPRKDLEIFNNLGINITSEPEIYN